MELQHTCLHAYIYNTCSACAPQSITHLEEYCVLYLSWCEQALRQFELVLKLDQTNPKAHYHYARTLHTMGR